MDSPENQLRHLVAATTPRLKALTPEQAALPRAAGKWSPKEILGHLIDSASNNHGRFVRAQFSDDLVCGGYDQNAWVSSQRYDAAPWGELIDFWTTFNNHLARVIENLPPEARTRPRARHDLNEVAFRPVPASEPVTLEYFMLDYVVHLKHHLAQILGPSAEAPR